METLEIINYNPLMHSDADNKIFTDSYRALFNQSDNMKYMSLSGIAYTEQQYKCWNEEFNPGEKIYLNAVIENKLVGFAIITRNPHTQFEVLGLCIDKHFQRRGISKRLLTKSYELAKEENFKAIQIEVFADNIAMLCNVINEGFKPIQIDFHKRFDGEDIIKLKKYL